MKSQLLIVLLFIHLAVFAQNASNQLQGSVSFLSSQNVYVQFVSTTGIAIGDTLYMLKNNELQPAMVVKELSSISCVGRSIPDILLALSQQVVAIRKEKSQPIEVVAQQSKEAISVNNQAIEAATVKAARTKRKNADLDGRVSLSSYLNNTSDSTVNNIFRFNLSINAQHISNSNFSTECYILLTNRNTYQHYSEVIVDTSDLFSPYYRGDSVAIRNVKKTTTDVKIYNLAVKYDFDSTSCLTFGRKINTNLANIGAVDGLQFEKSARFFSYGAVVGSRPDTYNYSLNTSLLQFGAFVGHHIKNGNLRTSLAFFNQMNHLITDRRFAYIQHTNSLMKNMTFFGSMEIDLYGKVNNQLTTKLDVTSTYLSLRYRPFRKLSVSLVYDARKNIYYYETYKNYVDSILDRETRQGFRFRANYHPFNKVIWGGTAGYRLPTSSSSASINGNSYLTYTQLPFVNASLTIDATVLKTNYVDGMVYGLSVSRDFMKGKLFTNLLYRHVNYTFNTTNTLNQNIGEISISWRIAKKLLLSADFEGSMDASNKLDTRLFVNISQRF